MFVAVRVTAGLLLGLVLPLCVAQTQSQAGATAQPAPATQPASSDNAAKKQDGQKEDGQDKTASASNHRFLFGFSNNLTVQNGSQPGPMRAKQKFAVAAINSFAFARFPWQAAVAGIRQANNDEPGFGQGLAGYGKRFGLSMADSTIDNFMTQAIFPTIFRQDPRYYQLGNGGFAHRAGYAASRILVTRGNSGRRQFNYSVVLGSALSASISTYSYYPKSTFVSTPTNPHLFIPSERTLTNASEVWGTQIGLDAMKLVFAEFWPSISRKLSHKHTSAEPASSHP